MASWICSIFYLMICFQFGFYNFLHWVHYCWGPQPYERRICAHWEGGTDQRYATTGVHWLKHSSQGDCVLSSPSCWGCRFLESVYRPWLPAYRFLWFEALKRMSLSSTNSIPLHHIYRIQTQEAFFFHRLMLYLKFLLTEWWMDTFRMITNVMVRCITKSSSVLNSLSLIIHTTKRLTISSNLSASCWEICIWWPKWRLLGAVKSRHRQTGTQYAVVLLGFIFVCLASQHP